MNKLIKKTMTGVGLFLLFGCSLCPIGEIEPAPHSEVSSGIVNKGVAAITPSSVLLQHGR